MQEFRSLVVVRRPVDDVWRTVRDRLPELVPRVDDVDRVRLVAREDLGDGRVRLVNEWWAAQRIPEVVARVAGRDEIGWIDRAEWDPHGHVVRWAIEPLVLPEAISCDGETTYEDAMGGRGTRVTVEGRLDFDADGLRGVAGPLQRPLAGFVESIASSLVPRSTRSLVQAAVAHLDEAG